MGRLVKPGRVWQERITRFNPLANLTPQRMTSQLNEFDQGYLWQIARTWEAISRRDDKLPALIGKRLAALSRYGWEILAPDEDAESQAHKAALEYTFNHLTCVSAVDENDRGGMGMALRKLGEAIGYRYSASELQWTPVKDDGGWQLKVEVRPVPLWFFENTTGNLRFLETPGATDGIPLDPGAWLIGANRGLMEPSGVLYMFKRLPLSDWLNFCETFGMPGVVGHTTASADSDAGRSMAAAVEAIGAELSAVVYGSNETKIEFLKSDGGSGQLPFPPLVERCDRGLAILWRGADLSTMSAGSGSGEGASLQGSESDQLEQDDAAWASEVFQEQIARRVIAWKFGEGTTPKAYLRIKTKQTPGTTQDLNIVTTAISQGFPVSMRWFSERFQIPMAKDGEETMGSKSAATPAEKEPGATKPTGKPGEEEPEEKEAKLPAENDRAKDRKDIKRYLDAAQTHVARAVAKDLQPLREALAAIVQAPDGEVASRIASFQANAPNIFKAIANGGATEKAIAESIAPALLDGMAKPETENKP